MATLDPRTGAAVRLALCGAALLAVLAASALRQLTPPRPKPADAPAVEFSGARAAEALRALAGHGAPRPVGAAANAEAARRLEARLRALGLEVRAQDAFACGVFGACARVRNVAARVRGAGPPGRKAVLLVAHHDSVGAGPGASDDLSGVAILLEAARALRAGPPLPRDVLLLSTDGEEAGLVGAHAFVSHHPWAREAGVAVNVEARGTEGPSVLFDVAGDAGWLVPAMRSVPRPVTTSVASALYDLLPNDTDLTALEAAGIPGLNFAFAYGAVRYHTPLDDVAHASVASIQHQGESALAAVRALAAADLEAPPPGRAVWLDVLALGVVAWPERAAVPVAACALAVAFAAAVLFRLRGGVRLRAVAAGVLGAALAPVLAAGAAWALAAALSAAGAAPRPWIASPAALDAAIWCAALAGALAAGALAGGRAGPEGMASGAALVAGGLALALAVALPGASPLLAVPAVALALAALGWAAAARDGAATALLPAAAGASGVALLPIAALLHPMLGTPAAPASAALVALAAFAPLAASAGLGRRARWTIAAVPAALAVIAAAAALLLPHATADGPERASIAYHEEEGRGRLLVESERGALDGALRDAAPFSKGAGPPFPWIVFRRAFEASAPAVGVPAPVLEGIERLPADGGRRVRARLASRRGAAQVFLLLPPGAQLRAFAMEGATLPARAEKTRRWFGDWTLLGCVTTPPGGVAIDLTLEGEGPVEAVVLDQTPGLPRAAAALAAARPRTAVPSQDGDTTIATARVKL